MTLMIQSNINQTSLFILYGIPLIIFKLVKQIKQFFTYCNN